MCEGEEGKFYPAHVKVCAVKMLGFYHSLDAKKNEHIKEMTRKGIN